MIIHSKYQKLLNALVLTYLKLSYNTLQWFIESYDYTDNKTNVINMKELYEKFSRSNYYTNLSKDVIVLD